MIYYPHLYLLFILLLQCDRHSILDELNQHDYKVLTRFLDEVKDHVCTCVSVCVCVCVLCLYIRPLNLYLLESLFTNHSPT